MKTYLLPLLLALALARNMDAAVILEEPFTYSDGPLTSVSGSAWTNYSGTALQMDVVSGKAVVSQAESEDVARPLSGAPYNGPALYASFIVNFSTLPGSGAGTYFCNFKDDGIQNLRCRVFATVTGAAAGTFRVGVANGSGTAVTISRDLSLATDYLLVVRYNTGNATSTLWIAPNSEGTVSDRADAADSTSATDVTTFVLRQSNAAGGMGILALDDLKVGTSFGDVVPGGDPVLNPPFISNIPNQSTARDGVPAASPFYVTDGETANGNLTLSFSSSNSTLVPTNNITFTSDGNSNRTVTATPVAGQQGVSEITVTVTDGDANTASRDFLLIVGAPAISGFSNLDIPKDTATPPIGFTVEDGEGDPLTVTALSSNQTLVPISSIVFGGSGPTRTITVVPASGLSGLSLITILVTDGFNTASNAFVLTVYPNTGPIFSDTFSYPDGPLATSSLAAWNTHSGTANQIQVLGGKVYFSGTNGEDVSAFLGVGSFPPHSGAVLYASFTANFKFRPTSGGNYFAHFRNAGTSFGAKIFSASSGAPAGKFHIGLANNANSPSVLWPNDLETNVTYTIVTRLNVGTGASRLWINPASEASPSIAAVDAAFPFEVFTYAFREDSGIGDIVIDDFKSGTAFTNVVETTYSLSIVATGADVQVSWPVAAVGFNLQFANELGSTWTDASEPVTVEGDQNIVRYVGTTGHRFFRLRKP